jgi:hypothetical protein
MEYLRARYYDSGTGRFLSRDPEPLVQPYAYGFNNPVNLTDPSGRLPILLPLAAGSLGFAAGLLMDCVIQAAHDGDWDAESCQAIWGTVLMLERLAQEARSFTTEHVLPAAYQCAIWSLAGAAGGGGLPGAAVGCGAGVISYATAKYFGANPVSACMNWGGAGFAIFRANPIATGAGCAAGVLSWANQTYGPGDRASECGIWSTLAYVATIAATKNVAKATQAGSASCLAGWLSA